MRGERLSGRERLAALAALGAGVIALLAVFASGQGNGGPPPWPVVHVAKRPPQARTQPRRHRAPARPQRHRTAHPGLTKQVARAHTVKATPPAQPAPQPSQAAAAASPAAVPAAPPQASQPGGYDPRFYGR